MAEHTPGAVPTDIQIKIMRLMAAGVQLREPQRTQNHTLVLNGMAVGVVRNKTVDALKSNAWVERAAEGWWVLTKLGRKHAESSVFVRAFSESPES